MSYTVGGEFGIHSELFWQSPSKLWTPPIKKPFKYWTDTGRSAIYLALEEILRRGGRLEAWVPSYCCPSILLPFRQLNFTVNLYSAGENLQTPQVPQVPDGATLLYIHYFGLRNNPMADWITQQANRRFYVIEDCAQAGLSENVGDAGDFAVYSYRKFYPQPDGAVLAADSKCSVTLQPPDEGFISGKIIGKLMRESLGPEDQFLQILQEAETRLDSRIIPRELSFVSRLLFAHVDAARDGYKRRSNWYYMINQLQRSGILGRHLKPLYQQLAGDEVPLGLPVIAAIEHRNALRAYLAEKRIYCPVHWNLDNTYASDWPQETTLSQSILTLPIDQRLDQAHLDYFVQIIGQYYKGKMV